MIFYISFITLIFFIICNLLGLYYFSKQEYNNSFVSLILDQNKLKLLKSKEINLINHKKIKVILIIQTILLIALLLVFIYVYKIYNILIIYLLIILIFIGRYISNKLIMWSIK